MAHVATACAQWKQDVLDAWKTGKTLKCALFGGTLLGASTTTYNGQTGELNPATNTGYATGGVVLTGLVSALTGTVASLDTANAVWPTATFAGVRQALIYVADGGTNRAVCVITFDADQSSSAADFTVTLPGDAGVGIIRFN